MSKHISQLYPSVKQRLQEWDPCTIIHKGASECAHNDRKTLRKEVPNIILVVVEKALQALSKDLTHYVFPGLTRRTNTARLAPALRLNQRSRNWIYLLQRMTRTMMKPSFDLVLILLQQHMKKYVNSDDEQDLPPTSNSSASESSSAIPTTNRSSLSEPPPGAMNTPSANIQDEDDFYEDPVGNAQDEEEEAPVRYHPRKVSLIAKI
ncbi:hypothetical protein FB446DRAFT_704150 [Lentinula raphanica]|nr:hypothetical protein FB446DRAFT_704150 [Lentinula raphanica]